MWLLIGSIFTPLPKTHMYVIVDSGLVCSVVLADCQTDDDVNLFARSSSLFLTRYLHKFFLSQTLTRVVVSMKCDILRCIEVLLKARLSHSHTLSLLSLLISDRKSVV